MLHLFALLVGLIALFAPALYGLENPADDRPLCAPFDYEQWRRDHPRPAGKSLADLDAGEPRTVRAIYFLPKGRRYSRAAVDTMKMRMHQVQEFFTKQMRANRQGSATFRFEADAKGEPLVHRVDGQRRTEYYNTDRTVDKVLEEVDPLFDMWKNVYYIAIDNGNDTIYNGDVAVGGVGSRWGKNGGWGMVPIRAHFGTVAHELGHAFGLSHDFRDDTYVMSYGFVPDWLLTNQRLSACNAEYLAVHPYFDASIPIKDGSWPTLEKRTSSPIQVAGARKLPVQIKVRDPDQLHQAILYAITKAPHFAEGFFEVKACRGLEGKKNPVVEFDYDGTIPSLPSSDFNTFKTLELAIGVVDALGDESYSDLFELVNDEVREPVFVFSVDHGGDWKWFAKQVFFSGQKLLALESSFEDDKVKLWDVKKKKAIATLPRWGGPVETWAFSPDGELLALESSDSKIKLWDVVSKKTVFSIDAPHGEYEDPDVEGVGSVVSALAFSPDGQLLASGGRWDYLVKLWDIASGGHVATFSTGEFSGTIGTLAFSPDGALLAVYAGGTVTLWDVARKRSIAVIDAHEMTDPFSSSGVAFSPDGSLLATGGKRRTAVETEEESEVKLWDVASRELTATLSGSAPVAFSPDGSFLVSASWVKTKWVSVDGSEDGVRQGEHYGGDALKLWNAATGKAVATLPPYSIIEGVAFSPDGRLLAEKLAGVGVRQWDVSEWAGEVTIVVVEEDDSTEEPVAVEEDDAEDEDEVTGLLPQVFFSTSAYTVSEDTQRLEIAVSLSHAIDEAVSVRYATVSRTAKAGQDYHPKNRTLVIPAEQEEKTIRLSLIDDSDAEGEEYFEIRLKEDDIENAVLGDPNRATITITDNDGAAKITAFPNPFNSQTVLSYTLPAASDVRLEVFALNGQ